MEFEGWKSRIYRQVCDVPWQLGGKGSDRRQCDMVTDSLTQTVLMVTYHSNWAAGELWRVDMAINLGAKCADVGTGDYKRRSSHA